MPDPDLRERLLDLEQPAPALTDPAKRYNLKGRRDSWVLTVQPLSWTRRRMYAAAYNGGTALDNVLYANSELEAVEVKIGVKR